MVSDFFGALLELEDLRLLQERARLISLLASGNEQAASALVDGLLGGITVSETKPVSLDDQETEPASDEETLSGNELALFAQEAIIEGRLDAMEHKVDEHERMFVFLLASEMSEPDDPDSTD